MSERLANETVTPWGIPKDVWNDYSDGAELRRVRWVIENCQDVTWQELWHRMPVTMQTMRELRGEFEPFETPFGMPSDLFWSTQAEKLDPQTGEVAQKGAARLRREWVEHQGITVSDHQLVEARNKTIATLALQKVNE